MSLPQSKQQSPIRVRGMLRIELICEIPCNATHVRREKRRSSLKWIVQVQPDLVVICHAHGSHRGLFSRTHEHLLHSYVGPYDTPILVRMSRREVPRLVIKKWHEMCVYAFIDCHLQWTTAVVMLPVLSLVANICGCL